MKNRMLIVLGLAMNVSLFAQFWPVRPFEPIQLIGFKPQWYRNFYDPASVGVYDGYNQFRRPQILKVVNSQFAYVTFLNQETIGLSGFHIEKVNIDDGSMVWRQQYGYPVGDFTEALRDFYVNPDGNIEMLSQQFPEPYVSQQAASFTDRAILVYRVIDGNTGSILEESRGDANNPDTFLSYFSFTSRFDASSFFRLDKNRYEYWDLFYKSKGPSYWIRSIVSSTSKKNNIVSDSVLVSAHPILIPPIRISENEYIVLEFELSQNNRLILRHFDRELKLIGQDTTAELGRGLLDLYLLNYNPDRKSFLMYKYVRSDTDNSFYTDLLWIKSNGKLLQKVSLSKQISTEFDVFAWDDKGATLFTRKFDPDHDALRARHTLEIRHIQDTVQTVLKKWISKDTLRTVGKIEVSNIENSYDKLITWVELSYKPPVGPYIDQDLQANALSILRISLNNLIAATEDFGIVNFREMKLFPNPVEDFLYIDLEDENGTLKVFDVQGKMIIETKYEKKAGVNVSWLRQGLYFISLQNGSNVYNGKFVKL